MRKMYSEDDFRKWVIAAFEGAPGHVQRHEDANSVGIPDLSAGAAGRDYWLELKYDEFRIAGQEYGRFDFKTLTRQQLEWLKRREATGAAICGVLGYFRIKPGDLTHYVFFCPPEPYLAKIWRGNWNVGAAILSPYCRSADDIDGPRSLLSFISAAALGKDWIGAGAVRG